MTSFARSAARKEFTIRAGLAAVGQFEQDHGPFTAEEIADADVWAARVIARSGWSRTGPWAAECLMGVTYHTGALIAADRGERRMRARHRGLLARRVVPTVLAPVVAQSWRGSARQVQLAGCWSAAM